MTPTLGGFPVFGVACKCTHTPNQCSVQTDSFAGINGEVELFLGSRGRSFAITGVFLDADPLNLEFDEQNLLSFADGIARTFTDTAGGVWQNVVFHGEYQRDPAGPRPTLGGWMLRFQCILHGLS